MGARTKTRVGAAPVAVLAAVLVLVGCGSGDPEAQSESKATSASPWSPTPSFDYYAGVRNCRVTEDAGTYYLTVASQTDHNFSACDGLPAVQGDADALLKKPGVDRRCLLDDPWSVQKYDANVGVYSDTKRADLAAARERCRIEHGHNYGS